MSRPNPLTNHPAVSFTVRRPSPLSREASDSDVPSVAFRQPLPKHPSNSTGAPSPLSFSVNGNRKRAPIRQTIGDDDSSDDEASTEDEIITGFDAMGVQRAKELKPSGPLVIPGLANRDWRAVARKRQAIFVPESAKAATGKDGSVGGLGTRDTINSGPQLSGLVSKRQKLDDDETRRQNEDQLTVDTEGDTQMAKVGDKVELTEEERALRAILSGDNGDELPQIEPIPPPSRLPMTETDAYREDVQTRPDLPTLEDYARVPVEQFGEALLRGMGWKEGMAASRTRKGPVEPYLPTNRPALLGIGAKERIVDEAAPSGGIGSKGPKKPSRPEKRYIPLVKKPSEGSSGANGQKSHSASPQPRSSSSSRYPSRSPPPQSSSRDGRDRDGKKRPERSDDDGHKPSASSARRDSGRDRDNDRGRRYEYDGDRHRERKDYRDSERGYHSRRDTDRGGRSHSSRYSDDDGKGR